MSENEQDAILGRLIREDKEARRRLTCCASQARKAAILLDALTNPWGLDFDQLRNDVKPVRELTVGDFLEAVEKDVKLTATLKNEIDSIMNP